MDKITKFFTRNKKVSLSDIASPRPSRAANRAVKEALKRAHDDQEMVSRQAKALRTQ